MSNDLPFEFAFQGSGTIGKEQVLTLAKLLDEWCTATYGADEMINGLLAFDDEKNLVGVRVEAHGPFDDNVELVLTHPGENAWDLAVEWMHGLGANDVFGFVRRCAEYGHGADVGQWDSDIAQVTASLARDSELNFQGHLITNGIDARILLVGHRHNPDTHAGVNHLLSMVDRPTLAAIGQAALDQMLAMDPDTDPEVIAMCQQAIARAAANDRTPLSPEEIEKVNRAMAKMQERLDQVMAGEVELQDPPTIRPPVQPQRPDVPPAFYH